MQLVAHNPSQFDAGSDLSQPFQRLIANIDQSIIQANLYKVVV